MESAGPARCEEPGCSVPRHGPAGNFAATLFRRFIDTFCWVPDLLQQS